MSEGKLMPNSISEAQAELGRLLDDLKADRITPEQAHKRTRELDQYLNTEAARLREEKAQSKR